MTDPIGKTPLHPRHLKTGAKMGAFGGYEMPMWYPSGPKAEHLAVINRAGMFDTSHMAAIITSGEGAFALLQRCFSKDLQACIGRKKGPLVNGRCVYGVFLNDKGGVVDDALVYRRGKDDFMIIVNAGMGPVVTGQLRRYADGLDVHVRDLTDQLGKIDVQGPNSARLLVRVLKDPERVFEKMPYFSFRGALGGDGGEMEPVWVDGDLPVLLSRTGYTGEFGFELFVDAVAVERLWEVLLKAGEGFGLVTCGLAARDSLRVGAVLPLSHQDIGDWPFLNHPWPFALPWDDSGTGFTKDFVGAGALLRAASVDHTLPFVGFDPRKVPVDEDTAVLDGDGNESGCVLTSVTDMAIDRHQGTIYSIASPNRPAGMKFRGLGCGFVKVRRHLAAGEKVRLKSGSREVPVEIVTDIRPDRTARVALANML